MKLYWAPRTRSMTAIWILEEAGMAYESEVVDYEHGAAATPQYRAINPMMKVPALVDGEARVAESAAICAYVAERAPQANLAPPVGDPRRGRYLQWLFFMPGCIEPAYTQRFLKFEMPTVAAGWGSYERVMEVLDGALQQGPWLLGDQFTAADVAVGSALRYGIDIFKMVEATPAMRAYVDRCAARPAFQKAEAMNAG